jgi:TonB-dependent starch-binding outer membrane protein SusC
MTAKFLFTRSVLAFLLMLACTFIYAQKRVTGSVLDPNNQPVSGATVNVTGTNESTQTDLSGHFSINVPQGRNSLTISFVGNETQVVDISDKTVVSVSLKTNNNPLEGVVVVGYGTQRRSDVTGAIGTVSAKEIADEPVLQVGQALQGKVAGLQISQNSGAPGSGLLIRVRGTGTVNNAEPLYVVDGNPNVNPLDISPDQIESIQILKSASAAAIYGAQGANGVVLITTKQGRAGKSQLDINYSRGWQQIQRYFPVTNAREYAILYNEGLKNAGQAPAYPNPDALGEGTNWQKEIFQIAPMTDVSVAASGGNESSRFYFSGGYTDQEGIIKGSSFDRATLRVNSSHTINKFLKVGQNLSASIARYSNISEFNFGSILGSTLTANPDIPVRKPDGTFGISTGSLNSQNVAATLYYNNNDTRRPVANGNAYLDFTPIKNLVFRSQYNFNIGFSENKSFSPQWRISPQQGNDVAQLTENTSKFREYSWANTLTYQRSVGQHSFDVLAGITNQESFSQNILAHGRGLPEAATENENLRYLNLAISNYNATGGAGEWGILSYLGRINYNYASKYFATVNFRADGSSRFGENNKWGYFPSFSLGWKLSEENFMEDITWMDNLMVRAGWGSLGNQGSLPNYAFANLVTPNINYAFGNAVVRGQAPTTVGNPDLKWESTKETNLGFDFSGFAGKVTASFDWYRKKTTDMLLRVPLVGYTGITADGAPFVNGGSILNKGVEIQLGYDKRATTGINYNISANVAFNKNNVLEVSNTGTAIQQFISFVGLVNSTQVGAPIASFFGWTTDGIFQSQDEVAKHAYQSNGTAPGDWRFRDLDGNDTINALDQTVIGNPWPKATFGLTGGISYKNIDFRLQLQGTYGNDIFQGFKFRTEGANFFNYTKNVWDNRWTGPNTSNSMPRLTTSDPNNNMRSSTYYVEDGSYLRVRNIQLGYRIPSSVSHLRSARIYASVQNAFTFTKYSGFDPEIGTNSANNPLYIGIDETNYPLPRIYTIGLNIGL